MPLPSDEVCFFMDCPRHQPVRDSRPGWPADTETSALNDWFDSVSFVESRVAAQESAEAAVGDLRVRFRREVTDVRRCWERLPVQQWAGDERQQAAVRYWMKRHDEPEVPTLRVCASGRRSRFTDPIGAMAELLDRVRWVGGGFSAKCPAHEDRSPSLSVSRGRDNRMLLHCFAGCRVEDVLGAVGWRMVDMFVST
jgi:hypothetical protein